MSMGADLGDADPVLAATLRAWEDDDSPVTVARVHAALAAARLLVPIVARTPAGGATEMALPTLIGQDGREALLAFTSVAALAAWDSDARPVPAPALRVLAAAVQQRNDALVLDVAGPVTFVVEGPEMGDLAAGFVAVDAADQEPLTGQVAGGLSTVAAGPALPATALASIATALGREPAVAEGYLLAGERGPAQARLTLGLVLREDLGPRAMVALVQRVAGAADPVVADGMELAVLTGQQRDQARALGPPLYDADGS